MSASAAAYPFDMNAESRAAIISGLQAQYDRFDPAEFETDTSGRYPLIGAGKHAAVLDWIYPATHLILAPRPWCAQADRDLGRKMILRAIRQGRYLNPGDPAHGIWYWKITDEGEPPPTDRNTPGFTGCGMLRTWAADRRKFDDWSANEMAEFKAAVRISFEAGERHWVRLGYTNPQCLDLFLGFAAADLLEDDAVRIRTRKRLADFVRFASVCDSFEEWLSPTYAGVNLTGLVPLRWYVRDTKDETAVAGLLDFEWKLVAAGSHAPTREICHPHSRAYGDLAIEHGAGLYVWLHLAAPDIYTFDPDRLPPHTMAPQQLQQEPCRMFDGLAAPGLYYPLNVPPERLEEIRSVYPEPVEKRFSIEWVGRHGWLRGDGIVPDDITRPEGSARCRMGSYYKTAAFCLGTVNESFVWVQRRPCGAYWNDRHGAATGIRIQAVLETAAPNMPFFVFNLLEYAGIQDRDAVLGALVTSTVRPADGSEKLISALDAVGLSRNGQKPGAAAWLLGTHWREGLMQADLEQKFRAVWFGITPLGRGTWRPRDAEGRQWAFEENGIQAAIELHAPGRIEELPRLTRTPEPVPCLTIGALTDVTWNLLALPDILWPFALQVSATDRVPETAFEAAGTAAAFEIKNRTMRMTRTATPSWDAVTQSTWRGWVNGREILP